MRLIFYKIAIKKANTQTPAVKIGWVAASPLKFVVTKGTQQARLLPDGGAGNH
jgi:hypothetical protein